MSRVKDETLLINCLVVMVFENCYYGQTRKIRTLLQLIFAIFHKSQSLVAAVISTRKIYPIFK